MIDQRAGLVAEVSATATGDRHGERGVGAPLSESEIVAAALQVVRTDGVQKLSMRRLSRELGVSPMAPYYYVADKSELLDLVATAALSGVVVPEPGSGPWQQRLRQLIDRIDTRLRLHPGVAALLNERTMQKQVDLTAAFMDVLTEAGFSEQNTLAGYAVVHTYLFGRERLQAGAPVVAPDVTVPPVVHRAHQHVGDLPYIYDFGVETVIAGLEAQLVRQGSAP